MIYYIYKIHFLCGFPSGRYYIGKRKYRGNDIAKDSYAGSGSFCKEYFKFYGKKEGITYIKEILEINPSLKINNDRETELIGTRYKDDPLCMNRVPGGLGGNETDSTKVVNQYDLNGNLLATYPSESCAAILNNCSVTTISHACISRYKVFNESIWRFENDILSKSDLQNLDFSFVPVDQYSRDGSFVKSYSMIKDAAIEICENTNFNIETVAGMIADCIRRPDKRRSAVGFIWKKRGESPKKEDFEGLRCREQLLIYQYDLNGNLLNTFNGFREAANFVNGKWQSIQRVCDGKRKTAYGYVWKRNISANDFAGYSKKQKQNFYNQNRSKKVNQYDLNGTFIRTFNSIREACDILNLKGIENIRGCCTKKYITSKGYIWRYEDDPDKQLSKTVLRINKSK